MFALRVGIYFLFAQSLSLVELFTFAHLSSFHRNSYLPRDSCERSRCCASPCPASKTHVFLLVSSATASFFFRLFATASASLFFSLEFVTSFATSSTIQQDWNTGRITQTADEHRANINKSLLSRSTPRNNDLRDYFSYSNLRNYINTFIQ